MLRFGTLGDDAFQELFGDEDVASSALNPEERKESNPHAVDAGLSALDREQQERDHDESTAFSEYLDSETSESDDEFISRTTDDWATSPGEIPISNIDTQWAYEELFGSPYAGLPQEVGFTVEEDILPTHFVPNTRYEAPEQNDSSTPSRTTTSRRLAREFLLSVDELSPENVQLLGDIIEQKGWSATQVQIRALFLHGTSMQTIHHAWQLRELWQYAHHLHAAAEEEISYRVHHSSLITWIQAVVLIEHFYWVDDPEEVISELEQLADHWSRHPELTRTYPVFKDYLFRYRLARIDHRHDLGLQINLDPHDERTFDGRANGCLREWWHDEID